VSMIHSYTDTDDCGVLYIGCGLCSCGVGRKCVTVCLRRLRRLAQRPLMP